ncbi:MAG: peroxiredoxin [Actinobacteria bacterium]|nr:MAG: peroxiredoxin [Actinomycetota bacterium]
MQRGDIAPDFELSNQSGAPVRLSSLLTQGPVVLYFYPKAMTPGCTAESCHFRDMASEFAAAGARRVGISADAVDRQATFADRHGLDFPLLSDPDRAVARSYGVKRPGPLFSKRTTFVIGQDGRILDVISSEINMRVHADRALAALGLARAARAEVGGADAAVETEAPAETGAGAEESPAVRSPRRRRTASGR